MGLLFLLVGRLKFPRENLAPVFNSPPIEKPLDPELVLKIPVLPPPNTPFDPVVLNGLPLGFSCVVPNGEPEERLPKGLVETLVLANRFVLATAPLLLPEFPNRFCGGPTVEPNKPFLLSELLASGTSESIMLVSNGFGEPKGFSTTLAPAIVVELLFILNILLATTLLELLVWLKRDVEPVNLVPPENNPGFGAVENEAKGFVCILVFLLISVLLLKRGVAADNLVSLENNIGFDSPDVHAKGLVC